MDGRHSAAFVRDGTHAPGWVRFWAAVRARASELLGRSAIAGFDYAISEIVHCKSDSEVGVSAAEGCSRPADPTVF